MMFLKTKNSNDTDSDQIDAKEDLNGEKKTKNYFFIGIVSRSG